MAEWIPQNLIPTGPRYLALMRALHDDVAAGKLQPGDRLPAHRDLAYRLSLSVGTVGRAYVEAERRGLVFGHVGRGTFVRGTDVPEAQFFGSGAVEHDRIDLSLNLPPTTGQTTAFAEALAILSTSSQLRALLRYLPHSGLRSHRELAAAWISNGSYKVEPDRVVICHGAQHGMALALSALAKEGDTILTEQLTYAGIKAVANHQNLRLLGVAMDEHGLIPEAVDEACAASNARVLYTLPTVQNPTGTVMPRGRRHALAEVVSRRKILVVESDVYGFLAPEAPPPLASLIPESVVYITSVSKCMAPGLRIGFIVSPASLVDHMVAGVRATAWMATPLIAELVARWIADGTAIRLGQERREEAIVRRQIADRTLGNHISPAHSASYHVWLGLPDPWTGSDFVNSASKHGIIVTPPDAVSVQQDDLRGVRLCLGAAEDQAELERALGILARLLSGRERAA